jgi:hypothetical protein
MTRPITTLIWLLVMVTLTAGLVLPPLPIRIHNHRGGLVSRIAAEVDAAGNSGRRVEISGGCWSSCTMYLGLPDVCVDPKAKFGFHGPSSGQFGIGVLPKTFETASRVMAAHYPEPIRSWFMREGRNVTVGFTVMTGADLIAMGTAKRCR